MILIKFNEHKIQTLPYRSCVFKPYSISASNTILQKATEKDYVISSRGTITFGALQLHVFYSFSLFMRISGAN